MAGPPSKVHNKRTSRYVIPRSVVDPRGSILAYPDSPSSTVYPFTGGRQAPQAPQSRFEEDDEKPLTRYDTIDELKDNASIVEGEEEQVLGSTEIFDKDGNIRLVPVSVSIRVAKLCCTDESNEEYRRLRPIQEVNTMR